MLDIDRVYVVQDIVLDRRPMTQIRFRAFLVSASTATSSTSNKIRANIMIASTLVVLFALALAAQAFAPVAMTSFRPAVSLAAEPEQAEEDSLDLDLGEMFDMFEAADNDDDFDSTMKKVKGDE